MPSESPGPTQELIPAPAGAITEPGETALGVPLPAPAVQIQEIWQRVADVIADTYDRHRGPIVFPATNRSLLGDRVTMAHLLQAIDAGLTPQQAGSRIGLTQAAVNKWLTLAKDPTDRLHPACSVFAEACEVAKNARRSRLLQRIETAGEKPQFWTASAWLLERGYGHDYKLAQPQQNVGVTIQIGIKDSDVKLDIA